MFKFVVICVLLATASAQHHGHEQGHGQGHASNSEDAHAEILHSESDLNEHGGFIYNYETSNHIKAIAEGDEHGNVHGDFQWISPEGEHIEVNYVADENGYQPKSAALPTPPPIPDGILKGLKYIETHPHYQENHPNHQEVHRV